MKKAMFIIKVLIFLIATIKFTKLVIATAARWTLIAVRACINAYTVTIASTKTGISNVKALTTGGK